MARDVRCYWAFLTVMLAGTRVTRSEKGVIMIYERIKKIVVTLVLSAVVILSAGTAVNSDAMAQGRRWDRHDRWDRRGDRDDLERIRRLDHERQLRYRWNNSIRVLGYHDRFGRFHQYGFYDRFGRFHRY